MTRNQLNPLSRVSRFTVLTMAVQISAARSYCPLCVYTEDPPVLLAYRVQHAASVSFCDAGMGNNGGVLDVENG